MVDSEFISGFDALGSVEVDVLKRRTTNVVEELDGFVELNYGERGDVAGMERSKICQSNSPKVLLSHHQRKCIVFQLDVEFAVESEEEFRVEGVIY